MPLVLRVDGDGSSNASIETPLVGGRVLIGSSPDAHLRLHALLHRHAVAVRVGDEWRLTTSHDVDVGGIPVASKLGRLLCDGSSIRIGTIHIRCVESDTALPADLDTAQLALGMLRHADKIGAHPTRWTLLLVEGAETEARVLGEGQEVVIGRDAEWQIDDERASRRHFEVRVRSGSVELRDLGSAHGTVVGGHPLVAERWARWRRDDHVKAGSVVFAWIPPREQVVAQKVETMAEVLPPEPVAEPASELTATAPTKQTEKTSEAQAVEPGVAAPVVELPPTVMKLQNGDPSAPASAGRRTLHPLVVPLGLTAILLVSGGLLFWILRD